MINRSTGIADDKAGLAWQASMELGVAIEVGWRKVGSTVHARDLSNPSALPKGEANQSSSLMSPLFGGTCFF